MPKIKVIDTWMEGNRSVVKVRFTYPDEEVDEFNVVWSESLTNEQITEYLKRYYIQHFKAHKFKPKLSELEKLKDVEIDDVS